MELGQGASRVVGAFPAWMTLGPPVFVDGVEAHAVLGDWSQLHECDRPPQYVIENALPVISPRHTDRSPDRVSLSQSLPGIPIQELKGKHSGKVAIFFNGKSLGNHDLHRIKEAGIPIIGMNRTYVGFKGYEGPETDYLCVVDHDWFDVPEVTKHKGLINGSTHKKNAGYRVTRSIRMAPFSTDLGRDGYVYATPATTGFLALQAAAYMGFTELYCLGLDMTGGHFDGTPGSQHFYMALLHLRLMKPVMEEAGLKTYVCGSPASKAPFEKVPYEELFA
jgi:hypothetical protein